MITSAIEKQNLSYHLRYMLSYTITFF